MTVGMSCAMTAARCGGMDSGFHKDEGGRSC